MKMFERKEAQSGDRLDFACEFKFADEGQTSGVIEGYASMFNLMDRGGDMVLKGAFSDTLAQWKKDGALPPMLWQHDTDEPIGVWTDIIQDEKGLKVKGEFLLETEDGADAYVRVKRGAVRGLSIGFRTLEDEVDRKTGVRKLKKVELWEISLVTIPMLKEAQVFGVKSDMLNFNPREIEGGLRDAGLSRKDAATAMSYFRKTLLRDAGEPEAPLRDGARDVLLELRKATASLRA
jgi:HK97 family phage prohead protease